VKIALCLLLAGCTKTEDPVVSKPAPSVTASAPTISDQDIDKMIRGLGPMPSGGLAAIGPQPNVTVGAAPGTPEQDTHDVLAMHDAMQRCIEGTKSGSVDLELSLDASGKVTSAKDANAKDLAKSELSCMTDRALDAHFGAGKSRTVKLKVTHDAKK